MQKVLDLLLPPTCPGCGLEGEALCPKCRAHMARRLDEPAGVPIGLPSSMPPGIVQLEWCASFNGPARASVHALKYDGERRLVKPLSELMAARWRRAGIGGDILVPVPVHAAKRRQRGFDQAELLARGVGAQLGIPVIYALQRAARTDRAAQPRPPRAPEQRGRRVRRRAALRGRGSWPLAGFGR